MSKDVHIWEHIFLFQGVKEELDEYFTPTDALDPILESPDSLKSHFAAKCRYKLK